MSLAAGQEGQGALWNLLGSVPVVKYGPKPKTRAMRKLLGDFGFGDGSAGTGTGTGTGSGTGSGTESGAEKDTAGRSGGGGGASSSSSSSASRATSRKGNYISFWKPEVGVNWEGSGLDMYDGERSLSCGF